MVQVEGLLIKHCEAFENCSDHRRTAGKGNFLQIRYQHSYYFSRLFTKVMGVSPNEYREDKKIH
jgi:Bacterial regulatory helix-turn-helix proteins, AraC family